MTNTTTASARRAAAKAAKAAKATPAVAPAVTRAVYAREDEVLELTLRVPGREGLTEYVSRHFRRTRAGSLAAWEGGSWDGSRPLINFLDAPQRGAQATKFAACLRQAVLAGRSTIRLRIVGWASEGDNGGNVINVTHFAEVAPPQVDPRALDSLLALADQGQQAPPAGASEAGAAGDYGVPF